MTSRATSRARCFAWAQHARHRLPAHPDFCRERGLDINPTGTVGNNRRRHMTRSCFSLDMDTFNQTNEAIRNDPKLGQGNFATVTEWTDGSQARTTARSFTIETDEPAPLGGTDKAIDPMELLLAAVGTLPPDRMGHPRQQARRGIPVAADRDERRLRPVRLPRRSIRASLRDSSTSPTPSRSTPTPIPTSSRRSGKPPRTARP